jgi:hypothetical protein
MQIDERRTAQGSGRKVLRVKFKVSSLKLRKRLINKLGTWNLEL